VKKQDGSVLPGFHGRNLPKAAFKAWRPRADKVGRDDLQEIAYKTVGARTNPLSLTSAQLSIGGRCMHFVLVRHLLSSDTGRVAVRSAFASRHVL
jgi:hypothetical protein